MDEQSAPCTRLWLDLAEGRGAGTPGRSEHLRTCPTCRGQFAELVTQWATLRRDLRPKPVPSPWTPAQVERMVAAMRRAARGDDPRTNA